MEMEIYDSAFHRLGYLEQAEYATYTDKLYECGSFSVKCPLTMKNADLLKTERIVYFEHDIAGIIQNLDFSQTSAQTLEIKGNLLDTILDWRYIHPVMDLQNTYPHIIMQEAVRRNFVTAAANRRIPALEVADAALSGYEKVSKQQTGGSVLDFQIDFGPPYDLGFHVGMDRRRKKFCFRVIAGVDHTVENKKGNRKILFSDDLNNILQCDYTQNTEPYRNVALVAGERTDQRREELIVTATPQEMAGWERRELYVDARDIQSTRDQVELSPAEYQALLRTRGNEKLAEHAEIEAFEAEVNNTGGTIYQYKRDYDLGDYVTAEKRDLGIRINAQITEVQVTYDKSGYSVSPTIGRPQFALYTVLKRKGV